jgi:hypothetical protein
MFHLHITQSDTLIQQRSYYSAHECTIAINKAWNYYFDREEVVTVNMVNDKDIIIFTTTTDIDPTSALSSHPVVSEAESCSSETNLAPLPKPVRAGV